MNSKYYAICKQQGLSDEEIREIDKALGAGYNSLRKEKRGLERLVKEGNNVFSIQDKEEHHSEAGERYEIPNQHYNLEEEVINQILMEQMKDALMRMPAEDRNFILRCMSGQRGVLKQIAEEQGVHKNTVINHKEKIIAELRVMLKVENC